MKQTTFQHPELRDANDNIIQQGAFGKNTALANSTNDGWIDYVANNLEALYDNINGSRIYVANKAALPAMGDLSAMYIAEDTGKWYLWDGQKYIETDNARKIADEAIAARDAAKASANDAANSAREQQADWNVTDTTNQAFIKNKPAVYPRAKTLEIEDTRAQINTPSFFINNYNRRIKSDFKIEDSPEAKTFSSFITITPWDNNTGGYPSQLAFTVRGNIFYRIGSSNEEWGNWKRIPLEGETIARATADASGNVITKTYARKDNASITNLTVTGETNVPTANSGNSSNAIANTEYVQGELTNYLPLSGGTLTGVVNGVTPTAGDNSTKIATTEFVNAKALTYQQKKFNEPSKWEDNTIQSIARAFPDDHPAAYEYGVKVTLGKIRSEEGHTNLYFPHNGGMYLKNYWGSDSNTSGWLTMLTDQNYSNFALPKVVGAVVAFAGRTTPQGWLLCDGSAVSRTDYAALYAVIGTTYGSGNGSTTFNLPNLVDKFVEGSATAGTVKSAGLPNITGTFGRNYTWPDYITANGAVSEQHYTTNYYPSKQSTESGAAVNYSLDASRSSAIYGNSNTVQPPSVTMRYIIKY